jgi:hypothetical protein
MKPNIIAMRECNLGAQILALPGRSLPCSRCGITVKIINPEIHGTPVCFECTTPEERSRAIAPSSSVRIANDLLGSN